MASLEYPIKKREMHNHHMDSTVWNDFKFRDGDVVVGTYSKTGTTWTQQIVSQLVWGVGDHPVADLSPWLDLRVPPKEVKFAQLESQTGCRIIKTHLPVDALVISPKAKYIYVARDGRDVLMSWYNHHHSANELWYSLLNDTPGLVGPPMPKPIEGPAEYFHHWLTNNGDPLWPFFDHVRSWWNVRHLPNVLLLHFNQLKEDLPGQVARISQFLGTEVADMDAVIERCTFKYMKEHGDALAPAGGSIFEGGGATFMHKGTNGRWTELYAPQDSALYEQMALQELGEECAHWLATGK